MKPLYPKKKNPTEEPLGQEPTSNPSFGQEPTSVIKASGITNLGVFLFFQCRKQVC